MPHTHAMAQAHESDTAATPCCARLRGHVVLIGPPAWSVSATRLAHALAQDTGLQIRCIATPDPHADHDPLLRDADAALLHVCAQPAQDLCAARACLRHAPLLVLGQCADLPALSELMSAGASDFLVLPCAETEIALRLQRLLGQIQPRQHDGTAPGSRSIHRQRLIGSSPDFLRQLARMERMAGCDTGVLILGETGTGKELFAQSIHYTSRRAGSPLVAVNCGAIACDLVEDELFGHVRGAFTTALTARAGLVREAEGGSLFLDDVDCLPLDAQAKLLRFLQEREYRAVGANTVQRADVRVIVASNRHLGDLVAQGRFRADLYYRLNVLALHLPPLRERPQDIAPLSLHFMRHHARQLDRPVNTISAAALARLKAHAWPGNVRELQHVIERAVLLCDGALINDHDIEIDDLRQLPRTVPGATRAPSLPLAPADSAASYVGGSAKAVLADASFRELKACAVRAFERNYLETLLARTQGNVTRAARAAGKNRRALFELIRKHDIEPDRFRRAGD